MKNSFIYDASIAEKLDSKKEDSIEQNWGTFSTVSDASGNFGEKPKGKDLNRNSIEAEAGKTI